MGGITRLIRLGVSYLTSDHFTLLTLICVVDSTRPSTTQEPWDAESIKRMPSARLERKPVMNSGPAIFVTDENNNRRDICELPGSEPEPQMFRSELESGQKYHAYRPKPS